MKFSTFTSLSLVAALVAASPVPAVQVVTVTHYTTIQVDQAEYTAAAQKNTAAAATSTDAPVAPAPTSTDAPVAPAPTSTSAAEAVATTSSTTLAAVATTTSSTAEQSATETSSASSGETFTGEGTYYQPGMGACGVTSSDSDHIVALSHKLYDQYTPNGNPNNNSLCGKKINVHYEGKTVQVTVVDRCEACELHDLDLSPSAFSEIADQGLGRIQISWEWAS